MEILLIVIGALLTGAVLVYLGYWLRGWYLEIQTSQLRAKQRVAAMEWDALQQAQQLHHLHWWGRQRVRQEEERARTFPS